MGLRASVLIATHNRCDKLMRTLLSLDRQTVPNRFEIVVAVDGSADRTLESLEGWRSAVPLHWLAQENRGVAAARNAAARLAAHEVLVFLDDDQLADSELIATHLAAHEKLGRVLVQGTYPLAAQPRPQGASMAYELVRSRAIAGSSGPPPNWHLWGANFSIDRATWEAVGGFDEGFRTYGGEDTDFGLRVAALGVPRVFEPRALSHHMHEVGYRAFARNAFSEGRSTVQLSRKHGLPLDALPGASLDGIADGIISRLWRWSPVFADGLGRIATAGLWTADRIHLVPVQLTMARLVRRLHRVGGATVALAEPVGRPPNGSVG